MNDFIFNGLFIPLNRLEKGERTMPEAEYLAVIRILVVLHKVPGSSCTLNVEACDASFVRTLNAHSLSFLLAYYATQFSPCISLSVQLHRRLKRQRKLWNPKNAAQVYPLIVSLKEVFGQVAFNSHRGAPSLILHFFL